MEIMDTTLRDGEQTQGVSFSAVEKLSITQFLLCKANVHRIEIGNARISEGEKTAIKNITNWAEKKEYKNRLEVLGFVDKNKSVDWILETGCITLNLLCKGSLNHLKNQLKKDEEGHLEDIKKTVLYAKQKGISINAYLEDWSNGIKKDKNFVFRMTKFLIALGTKRIMLPDTLGILDVENTKKYLELMTSAFPDVHFDFHAHNDYGLATANSIAAALAGAKGLHTTINCLGERAGNTPLDEIAVALKDFHSIDTKIDEKNLKSLSRIVEAFSGKRISSSKPICGEDVFTQTAGIHADGDKKGNLYSSNLTPYRFNRKRIYALGKMSGKASIDMNLEELNIKLSDEQKKQLLQKVVEYGDLKKTVTKEDLPFIISDILDTPDKKSIEILDYEIISRTNKKPNAKIVLKHKEKIHIKEADGDGGYDAFMNALKKIEKNFNFKLPLLLDYIVRIPPGGKTDSLVETIITWDTKDRIKTIGVDSDQVVAAIKATEKMLNLIEQFSS